MDTRMPSTFCGTCRGSVHAARPAASPGNPPDTLRLLEPLGTVMLFERGRPIYAEGDAAYHVYKLVCGTVRTGQILADGRRQIAEFVWPGSLFGLEALDEHAVSAEAVDDCTLIRYSRRRVEALAEADPWLGRRLREMDLQRILWLQERLVLLGRKTAKEKVASFLLEMADRSPTPVAITLPMSRTDIADYLGLTIETVCRVLADLKRCGAIAIPLPHRLIILRRATLEELDGEGGQSRARAGTASGTASRRAGCTAQDRSTLGLAPEAAGEARCLASQLAGGTSGCLGQLNRVN